MLALQAPGSVVVIYFQISIGGDFTTWVPYIVTFLCQMLLIGFCIFYYIRDCKAPPAEEGEKTSLLKSEMNHV